MKKVRLNFLGSQEQFQVKNGGFQILANSGQHQEELKKILLYSLSLLNDDGTFSGSSDMLFNISIISDYLQSLTNIGQILNNNNLTFNTISRMYIPILIKIKDVPEEYFLDYFLFELNNTIEKNNSKLTK